jgi:hypothetical protein
MRSVMITPGVNHSHFRLMLPTLSSRCYQSKEYRRPQFIAKYAGLCADGVTRCAKIHLAPARAS